MTEPSPHETMPRRRMLNAGSGSREISRLPPGFDDAAWHETTIDIDPATRPDHVGSFTDMRGHFGDATFDAIWSSHSIEHLYIFDLEAALAEFRRVLKPDGFALVTCPDIEAVAAAILTSGIDHVAYVAPAGPITLHDMIYGHTPSIARGATAMAHHTGLTAEQLGRLAMQAGFHEATVGRGPFYDLWAVLRMPQADMRRIDAVLAGSGAHFMLDVEPAESGAGAAR